MLSCLRVCVCVCVCVCNTESPYAKDIYRYMCMAIEPDLNLSRYDVPRGKDPNQVLLLTIY